MKSFYDILSMIKLGIVPFRIRVFLVNKSTIYYFDTEESSYIIEDEKMIDDIFKENLSETLNDIEFLERNIKIIPFEKKNYFFKSSS